MSELVKGYAVQMYKYSIQEVWHIKLVLGLNLKFVIGEDCVANYLFHKQDPPLSDIEMTI